MIDYLEKYLKYKNKYLLLQEKSLNFDALNNNLNGGGSHDLHQLNFNYFVSNNIDYKIKDINFFYKFNLKLKQNNNTFYFVLILIKINNYLNGI